MLDEEHVRREKREQLLARGFDPYPVQPERDTTCETALSQFETWSEEKRVCVLAGRLLITRVHGGVIFADLQDATGKLQLALKQDVLGEELFSAFRDLIDPGDIVEVRGTLFITKRGEKTLEVQTWRVLSKALRPLPEKWHGLQDVETRYRYRELDLISHPEVRQRFLIRSHLISSLRHFLDQKGFLEVETPMLQPIPGGANARPFKTHHNALDVELYLRIAPELYLKRLIVGGFEKVYEIGKCFRNEGIDYAHNPEFTIIELYWAYAKKEEFVSFMEELLENIIRETFGQLVVEGAEGQKEGQENKLDFTPPYPRTTFRRAIIDACGIDIDQWKTGTEIKEATEAKGLSVDFTGCVGYGEFLDALYKKTARQQMEQPTWVFDYPVDLKPLARRHPEDPTKSASVQLVMRGAEIINAYYHELNDPTDQLARFAEQQELRDAGSEEAQWMDKEFIRALEHGLPPTSGMGIGLDRLVAFLTGSPNLKEVILFPTLRPLTENQEDKTTYA